MDRGVGKEGYEGPFAPIAEGVWQGKKARFQAADRIIVGIKEASEIAGSEVSGVICDDIITLFDARVLNSFQMMGG